MDGEPKMLLTNRLDASRPNVFGGVTSDDAGCGLRLLRPGGTGDSFGASVIFSSLRRARVVRSPAECAIGRRG
jgi:hypothetical protein